MTVFEKNDYVGGHSRTRTITYKQNSLDVDTGFIVFNFRNYPNLVKLFHHYHVPIKKSDMSFAISSNGFEYSGASLRGYFSGNILKLSHWFMIYQIYRFNRIAQRQIDRVDGLTLKQFLEKNKIRGRVVERYILPMAGAIWSSHPDEILDFPAAFY